jgi:hypothetical protein
MMEYMKLIAARTNGWRTHETIAEGTWNQIKAQEIPGKLDLELVQYNRGQRCKVASGPWDSIRLKMEGAIGELKTDANAALEANCIPHLVLIGGLAAWSAFALALAPFLF